VKRIERHGLPPDRAVQPGVLARGMFGVGIKFGANTEICGEGEPREYVYQVVKGTVRTQKVLHDGRRKIEGFHFPGDIFGLFPGDIFGLEEADVHSLSAEAVVPSTVRATKRRTLIWLASNDRKLAEELLTLALREAARAHRQALMLIMTAQERVGSFLLEMGERIGIGDLVMLPMSRHDIADHLGVTTETVSRTFTILESASAIGLPNAPNGRAVVLQDRSALK